MAAPQVQTTPWAASRRRAEVLRDRHAFAAEMLTLYLALVQVWERAWVDAPASDAQDQLVGWAAEHVLPDVLDATARAGPKPLVEALVPDAAGDRNAAAAMLAAWLAGEELVPVERYLARATLRGPLMALDAGAACAADPSPRGGRRCPRCGGPPQFSARTDAGDQLVTGQRRLHCARCAHSWGYTGNACAYCGETEGGRRTVYGERRDGPRVGRGEPAATAGVTFPHLRMESCASCRRYLIDVDLGRDPMAVPEVDELAALPLDLYAAERGLTKITPNLMGF
jgi:FdhE protein